MNMLNNLMFLTEGAGKAGTILTKVATIAGAIIAILMIVMIVKSVLEYTKGSGTGGIGKIVGQVIFFLIALGLIIFAQNYTTWQGVGNNIVTNVTCIVQDTLG